MRVTKQESTGRMPNGLWRGSELGLWLQHNSEWVCLRMSRHRLADTLSLR
jgi:hypothetical protein